MDGNKFCGTPCHMFEMTGVAASTCKWNKTEITWIVTGRIPNISDNDLIKAYELAWSYWEEVCNIKPIRVNRVQDAMVVMGSGRIDGPNGTLAWSEMPCGTQGQLQQKYDTSENRWVISDNPPNGALDLVRVAAHEIGHAIGIPHISSGNLLAPTYSRFVRKPQAGDIREAQDRYGTPLPEPDPIPDPDPTPEPGNFWKWLINFIISWLKGRFGSKK